MITAVKTVGTDALGLDQCRRLALSAEISTSFIVWPDAIADPEGSRQTDSFAEAFDLIDGSPAGAIRVLFRWRLDDKQGYGDAEYSTLSFPTASKHFVQQVTRNRITEQIARMLLRDDHWPA